LTRAGGWLWVALAVRGRGRAPGRAGARWRARVCLVAIAQVPGCRVMGEEKKKMELSSWWLVELGGVCVCAPPPGELAPRSWPGHWKLGGSPPRNRQVIRPVCRFVVIIRCSEPKLQPKAADRPGSCTGGPFDTQRQTENGKHRDRPDTQPGWGPKRKKKDETRRAVAGWLAKDGHGQEIPGRELPPAVKGSKKAWRMWRT
jgi:hypothetical protein